MRRSLFAIVICLAAAAMLSAHPTLVKTTPVAGETLKASPPKLQLWFSEMPAAPVSLVTLAGPSGDIKIGKTVVNADKSISADVPTVLAVGQYTVNYRTADDDGHVVRDSFKFIVAPK